MGNYKPQQNHGNSWGELSKKPYAHFTLLLCMIVAITTLWAYHSRYQEYRYYQFQVSYESTHNIAPQITKFINETSRLVNVFTNKNISLLEELIDTPEDDDLRALLEKDLRQYFPQMLTFTLANDQGEPYWVDFDGLIGDLCRNELQAFAAGKPTPPMVHPINDGYHFDVMAKFDYQGSHQTLFVSFLASMLGDQLKAASTPDHQVMLVLPKNNDLIEVVPGGARDILVTRDDFRLSESEKKRILVRTPVTSTQWDVIDLIEPGVLEKFHSRLVLEACGIIIVFSLTAFILVFRLWRADCRRNLAEQERELAQQQKETVFAMVTHEFRTPLTAIQGAVDLLSYAQENEAERNDELLQIASRNIKRMQLLLNDFLDLKKLESSGFELSLGQADLAYLIDECISANSTYAKQFNVSVNFERPSQPVWVFADQERMSQVIANLLSNAIKYGGENHQVEIRLLSSNGMARVEVSDEGEGIAPDVQENVFRSFATLNPSNQQKKVKSTGLGLSIVKTIIEKHLGKIGIISQLGQGATFYFELPLYDINQMHSPSSQDQAERAPESEYLLTQTQKKSA